jgi:SAM-dependent methyltransferase
MRSNQSASHHTSACLVCGEFSIELRFVQRGYPVFRCNTCGLEFVDPTPSAEELAAHYKNSYAVSLERYEAASERNNARINELEHWRPPPGHLLEVGAAYGHSLVLARDRGWDVTGVELSPKAASYAVDHFGLKVLNCDLTNAPLEEGSFDAAIMWHVLEHARNPMEQLLRLAVLLKPGGVLGLRVPNIESYGARVAGQWWPWMCPPAHLWFFSRTTLPRLLRTCGYEVLEVKTMRGDGNNLYQYTLMWAGNWLNNMRNRLSLRSYPDKQHQEERAEKSVTSSESSDTPDLPSEPSGLLQKWLGLLKKAKPITNKMARGTRPLVESIERHGRGDELLVYAMRKP